MTDTRPTAESDGDYRVTCLVDNSVDLSSHLWAEHGSAFLVETCDSKVLFDTGQSGEVLAHNLSVLEKDLSNLAAVVLSHGHHDHTGGLELALSMGGDLEVVAHPAVFDERIARYANAPDKSIGIPFSRAYVEARRNLRLARDPVEVADGVFTSGQVPRGAGPEPPDSRLMARRGDQWVADPFLDDQSLVIETRQGLVVIMGCCHAGLINTLDHIRSTFSQRVHAIMGGTHLARADYPTLRESVIAAKDYGVLYAYVGHCTGVRGLLAFADVFGERGRQCPVGLSLKF